MRRKTILLAFLLSAAGYAVHAENASSPESGSASPGTEAHAEAHAEAWPQAKSPASISDTETERRIGDLLARMSLEQKIGQLVQADISTITPADLEKYPLGSILAGGNSGPYGNERSGPADWDRLVREFRAVSLRRADNGIAIPIIFGVDAVHGHNNIPGATIFPHNIGLGAARDSDLVYRIGKATANEVAGSGIEWTFAPTLAVPQDVRWGRAYEGYAADPALVADYARAMVLGLQDELVAGQPVARDRVAATAKHYLADGGTFEGKDQGDARISEQELISVHAAGYPVAIDAGTLTVMASFSSWNGVKNHGNASLLTNVLKKRMGFEGFVVGDWNGHGQIPGCSVTDCPQALLAGLDMYMAPDSWRGLYENLLRRARMGEIPAVRLDDAVRRILRVKMKLGLFDADTASRGNYGAIGAADHLALAREAVAKSMVLLKNNGSILPVKPGVRVLVAGAGADDLAMQSGGWTISWQGTDVVRDDFPNGRTIWDGLSDAVKSSGGEARLSLDGSFNDRPDVAIVIFGEKPYAEFQGDAPTLDYQPYGASDLALLKKLKGQGIPVVAVFLSGRPLFTSPEINAADAFVAAWLPGTQGDGVADVLVARPDGTTARDFTGRLPFPWPADARSPVEQPLFPTGYGLDYAVTQDLPQLSEDPAIDVAEAVNAENYFSAGRAQAPWRLSLTDAGGNRPVETSMAASPEGQISVRSIDIYAQEDGKRFDWTGPGSFGIDGPPADISRPLNNSFALKVEWLINNIGNDPLILSMANVPLDVTALAATAPKGRQSVLRIPLRCFADASADFSRMDNALRLQAGGGTSVTLLSAKVEAVGDNIACP